MGRHLPVVGQKRAPVGEEPPEERPPWHWVAIGAVMQLLAWLLLSLLAQPLAAGVARAVAAPGDARSAALVLAGTHVIVTLGIGSAASGALVGRFGGRAGPREAALSGAAAAAVACALTAPQAGVVALLVLAPLGALAAAAAWIGARIALPPRAE
ncbi:MAG: hypothetical protein IT374_05430 [Polyangiaceae bacterium]|nr:hypothetical protein [Polyangiaceae bacterium]